MEFGSEVCGSLPIEPLLFLDVESLEGLIDWGRVSLR